MAPHSSSGQDLILCKLRWTLGFFMFALVLSGVTAFPLQSELEYLAAFRGLDSAAPADAPTAFDRWILVVRDGLRDSYARYPWIAYGTDWLAFGHVVIALFFVGPWINPTRNVWVLQAGVIACVLVIPLAMICGAFRQIPIWWRLIDCAFGVVGVIPLLYALRLTRTLEAEMD